MLRSDRRYAMRAFALTLLLFAVAFAISMTSDEGGVRFGIRLGRALPLAPLCAGIAVFLTLGSVRAKVDALTLESIGRAPTRNNAGAVIGGAIFALIAAGAVGVSSRIDIEAIFPSFGAGPHIRWDGSAFVDSERGLRFDERGVIAHDLVGAPADVAPARASHERGSASLALGFAALAFPLFAAASTRRISAAVVMTIAAAAFLTFLAFDAVASGRAPAIIVALPQAALLFLAVVEYRRSGWLVPL